MKNEMFKALESVKEGATVSKQVPSESVPSVRVTISNLSKKTGIKAKCKYNRATGILTISPV